MLRGSAGRARASLRAAEGYFKEGKLTEAALEYRTALQSDPRFGTAYSRLGEIYDKQGDAGAALQAFVRAADLLPDDVDAQIIAANFLMAAGRFEDARTTALKAVKLAPKNVEALILVGNASAGLNDFERAISELQAAQALDKSDARIYNNLGWFEALRGRSAEAEAVFRSAVAAAPKSAAAHVALANYLSATGRREEAEKSLRTAVEVEPSHVPSLRALGWFLLMTNRAKEAEPFLVAAAQHDPKTDSQVLLADFYTWSGRDADAIRVLEELKAKGATAVSDAVIDTRLASIAYRADRPKAESLLKAALKADPRNLDAQLLSTQLLVDDHKLSDARTAMERILKEHPNVPQAHFLNGKILFELGQFTAAAASFNEVVRLNPRAVTAKVFLARLHLMSNRPADARQAANEVLLLAPGNPAARVVIVQALQATGDRAGAKRLIADLLREYPDWPPVQYEAARVAVAQADWPAARGAIERLNALGADSVFAFEGQLAVDVGTKDFKSAFQRIDARRAKNPTDERLLLVAAQVYMAAGDASRAESALRTAISVNPANSDAYDQLGRLYAQIGRLPDAETQFAALAEKSGEREYGWILAAVLAHAQGKVDVARQRYEKALSINPEAPVAANNLAWIYAEKGENLDTALNLAQTAKRLAPENGDFIDTLGMVLLKKGLFSAAIAELETAANRSPKKAIVHLHLAQALAAGGKTAEARLVARRALSIDPSFPEAKDARAIAEGKSN